MTHHKYLEQVSLWLDNELSPNEVNELQAHLAKCSDCTRFYQAMKQVDQALNSAVIVEPSPGFTQRFETRLQQRQIRQGRMWLGMTILAVSTLAMFVVAGILGWMIFAAQGLDWLLPTFYTYLGRLGGAVNELRAMVNLGSLLLKASFMTMQEPMFWAFVVITLAMTMTWAKVIQIIYRRSPLTTALFA
jgi:predicted anti-sigma-YlaC factor YlaD